MIRVNWKQHMAFQAEMESGVSFMMDAHPESGGADLGPTPVEAMLSALAACSAMDVISILRKKRQEVTSYRIEVDGDRSPEGEWPRPFTEIRVRHIVRGKELDPAAVARAVELSDEKYCTVSATMRSAPRIVSRFEIEE